MLPPSGIHLAPVPVCNDSSERIREWSADLSSSVCTPREARHHLRRTLAEWDASPDLIETALQIVSELVTNAFLHTSSERILLTARLAPDALLQPGVAASDEHGRGLLVVSGLATRYGLWPSGGGTIAWAAVRLPAPVPRQVTTCTT